MGVLQCPVCELRFDAADVDSVPFCSRRCQQLDLSRWLNEEYRVPWVSRSDEEEALEDDGVSPPPYDDRT